MKARNLLIGIVGPCGAGKTTLMNGLKECGYKARAIMQEHSYVPSMWQKLTKPDILIFLQASHATGAARRYLSWTTAEWEEQQRRLKHARQHANLYIDTNCLLIHEVLEKVLEYLSSNHQVDNP